MELEELKTEWQRLDSRLERLERDTDRLAATIAEGSFRTSTDRLRRSFRLGIALCLLVPGNFWLLLGRLGGSGHRALMVYAVLFALVALVRQLQALERLRGIDPARQSLREACAAVVRFRRFFLHSVCICLPMAVVLLLWLGAWMQTRGSEYLLCGFAAGLLLGIPLGIARFRRTCREIDALQTALEQTEV